MPGFSRVPVSWGFEEPSEDFHNRLTVFSLSNQLMIHRGRIFNRPACDKPQERNWPIGNCAIIINADSTRSSHSIFFGGMERALRDPKGPPMLGKGKTDDVADGCGFHWFVINTMRSPLRCSIISSRQQGHLDGNNDAFSYTYGFWPPRTGNSINVINCPSSLIALFVVSLFPSCLSIPVRLSL